jgi:intracellular multiplication protein IcmC
MQVIGVVAFIRGLLILKELGGGRSQATMGKALSHLIGGILCINLYNAIQVLETTVGWTP